MDGRFVEAHELLYYLETEMVNPKRLGTKTASLMIKARVAQLPVGRVVQDVVQYRLGTGPWKNSIREAIEVDRKKHVS